MYQCLFLFLFLFRFFPDVWIIVLRVVIGIKDSYVLWIRWTWGPCSGRSTWTQTHTHIGPVRYRAFSQQKLKSEITDNAKLSETCTKYWLTLLNNVTQTGGWPRNKFIYINFVIHITKPLNVTLEDVGGIQSHIIEAPSTWNFRTRHCKPLRNSFPAITKNINSQKYVLV